MQYLRLIAPQWLLDQDKTKRKVLEGMFSDAEVKRHNADGYNIYKTPNSASVPPQGRPMDGTDIDQWNYVFADCDLKDGVYADKDAFLERLGDFAPPTSIVDSGNGIHAYWQVSNLDAMSYLRFQRRIARTLQTDDATSSIFQLMRLPNTINTKIKGYPRPCSLLYEEKTQYTAEELDRLLPPITAEDEAKCVQHYDKTYQLNQDDTPISDVLPPKFGKLLRENAEVKDIWAGSTDDRSKNDYRLGHLMLAHGLSRDEALSVLINSAKALARAPIHRRSYAQNIVDKIWTFEAAEDKTTVNLSPSVRDILSKGEGSIAGTRFPCHRWIDDTVHGFRLGQVIGIIGGSGVGKTTLTLNAFLWFAENNPDYHHFFISLEQPPGEIAARIRTICGENDSLFDKIHIVSNYDETGAYKHFGLQGIQDHLRAWEIDSGLKIGTVVVDHIGVLDKATKNGEQDGLIGVCQQMKAFAVGLNVMLIMLSQAPREKAGIGDLELDKAAAYGTVFFESFVDYCLCLWQPLKRVYTLGAPTVMAIKFAKIRHKKQGQDRIQEDVCYQFFFNPQTERLREMTQDEEKSAVYFLNQATNARKKDRKTDIVSYNSRRLEGSPNETTTVPGSIAAPADSSRRLNSH